MSFKAVMLGLLPSRLQAVSLMKLNSVLSRSLKGGLAKQTAKLMMTTMMRRYMHLLYSYTLLFCIYG
jgi:hypothetical protein